MKAVFYTIISDSHYHGCRTDDFIRSFKKFHPDVDLVVFGQSEINRLFSRNPNLNFYNAKASFAKELYNDYDLVVNIDADHIILGRLDEILDGDYDVAAPANYNCWLNSGIKVSTFTNIHNNIKEDVLVPFEKYLQGGLVASTSKQFWDAYEHASLKVAHLLGHKENDVLNLLTLLLPYKFKILDGDFVYTSPTFKSYYNCASLNREKQMKVEEDKITLDGKQVKCYHFARGGIQKPAYKDLFSDEVVKFIQEKILV